MRYALALAVVLIVLVVVAFVQTRANERFLTGFWEADREFLNEAGLDQFYIMIEPADDPGKRTGYVVMTDRDGALLADQPIEIKYGWGRCWAGLQSVYAGKSQTWVSVDSGEIFPEELLLTIDRESGALMLKSEEKVYGYFYKNLEESHNLAAANDEEKE